MESFFVRVVVKAILQLIENPQFLDWLNKQKQGVTQAVTADVKAEIKDVETNLIGEVVKLPEQIVGDAESTVKGLVGNVPSEVQGIMSPMFGDIKVPGIDVEGLAKAIAQNLHIPFLGGFGGG